MSYQPKSPSFYRLPTEEVVKQLLSSSDGLNSQTASNRLNTYGPNNLKRARREPVIFKFFHQFKDLMIILLIGSAAISFYLNDRRTTYILLAIVIINSLIGFFQEFKAEKIMESLQAFVVAEAKVFRDKKLLVIAAADLVPGDIFIIEEGDAIPADGRILEESELATNDFALTGESNPTRKFTHHISDEATLGNRRNMVFMGTTVATGDAKCIVTATGMSTELGRIANLSTETKAGLSPLQREMNNLASRITVATLILAAFLILISLGANLSFKDALIFAIGISSAMIPQGLPAEVNIALAQAAGKLAKAKALVKKLSAVETLGATSVICTDKTGTLTKNEMTVQHITFINKHFAVSGSGYETNGAILHENGMALETKDLKELHRFLVTGLFASNAQVDPPDDTHTSWYCLGDPTEGALVVLARKAGIDTNIINNIHKELKEFPFDSSRKRMSSVRQFEGKLTAFVKGAPESVLSCCSHILADGKIRPLTNQDRTLIAAQNDYYANQAMRNLAYAYRLIPANLDYKIHDPAVVENNLIYMGLVSIIDPIREDVASAMQAARAAHVKVSIITGDYAPTAKAIAIQAKLADKPEDLILVGSDELPKLTDNAVLEMVLKGGVIFSRVSPEDKLRIVSLVKSANHIVAVTGDGINDAPALKKADIGVAMGKIGTDVAKQSAEIVLLDDSFSTLVSAIQQGRGVYQNIKKATLACLTSNFGELITVLIGLAAASLLGYPPAILAVQILAIDLIAELLPIAALGWDKPEAILMRETPRRSQDHIYNKATFVDLIITGSIMGSLAYTNFLLYAGRHGIEPVDIKQHVTLYAAATTLTYVTLVLCQLVNILIRRSESPTLTAYIFTNRHLWLAFGLSLFFVLNFVYNPWLQHLFGSSSLGLVDWLYAMISAVIFFILREIYKTALNRRHASLAKVL